MASRAEHAASKFQMPSDGFERIGGAESVSLRGCGLAIGLL